MGRFASLSTVWLVPVAVLSWTGDAACQQSAWYEGFEGPDVSWQPVGGSAQHRVELHQRIRGEAHTGDGCERLRIVGEGGTEAWIAHAVGRPRVIDDLLPTLWVKADRPGIQLAARIVLPRSLNPRSRQPLTAVVYGSSYTTVGRWQQLRLEDIPRLLTRETRALRAEYGPSVDPREAYVEQILLNVYGGPGVTNVWIDDLDIAGWATLPNTPDPAAPAAPGAGAWASPPSAPQAAALAPESPASLEAPAVRRVRLNGSVLLVDDHPTLPRVIQHQGEPLELLRKLGFNAVWLAQHPSAATLEQARRLGLWLIAPPPFGPAPQTPDASDAPPPLIGPEYDGVLAWDLGRQSGDREIAATRRWAEQIRMSDRRQPGRPLICAPASDLRAYSRSADVLLLGRAPLSTSLELSDYATWLREQPQLARPGSPIWTTVATQPAESLRQQWAAIGRGPVPGAFPGEQIQLLVYTAASAGSRGLVFESFSPLDAADPETRIRALTLQLLNLQLEVAEPLIAAGTVAATIPGKEKGVSAAVFHAEHGRLLLPIWSAPGGQFVSGQSAGTGVTLVVPGVPESYNAYLLVPGGLRPLRHYRQTGGVRITLDEFDLAAMVLLTENPLWVTNMTRRAAQQTRPWAQIERELAAAKLETIQRTLSQLPPQRQRAAAPTEAIASARKSLGQCDALLAARDEPGAYIHAVRALRWLRLLERAEWEGLVGTGRSPVVSPGAVLFATLPQHVALMGQAIGSRPAANLLAGGDFEDLGAMSQAGWRHFQHATPGLQCAAELAPAAAHGGRSGLRLAARTIEPQGSPTPGLTSQRPPSPHAPVWVESPPVWITSPPVPVEAGQIVVIHGWVQIPQPITGSVDGLLVIDSLGGEPLAERIRHTLGWRDFLLYRAVPKSGTVTVTFALTGLGEARLDDVTIQPLASVGPTGLPGQMGLQTAVPPGIAGQR